MKLATLSFDDGGWPDVPVLDILRAAGVTATFYLPAAFLDHFHYHADPPEIRARYEGFEVGCHSAAHPDCQSLGREWWWAETCDARERLRDFFGQSVTSWAWPYGNVNEEMFGTLDAAGFKAGRAASPGADGSRFARPIDGMIEPRFNPTSVYGRETVHLIGHPSHGIEDLLAVHITVLKLMGFEFVTNADYWRA